jgi:hypothetical protein
VVRERAADIVRATAPRESVPELVELYLEEVRPFVAGCLAAGLNRLTAKKVDVEKASRAKAAERQQYASQWRSP